MKEVGLLEQKVRLVLGVSLIPKNKRESRVEIKQFGIVRNCLFMDVTDGFEIVIPMGTIRFRHAIQSFDSLKVRWGDCLLSVTVCASIDGVTTDVNGLLGDNFMSSVDRESILNSLNDSGNSDVASVANWLTFVLSYTPYIGLVPGIANKIMTERKLSEKFKAFENAMIEIDSELRDLDNNLFGVKKIIESTEKHYEEIRNYLVDFVEALKSTLSDDSSELYVDTSNCSTQEIIDSIMAYDYVEISADERSKNVIKGSHVESKKTMLRATNGSLNTIIDSEFSGSSGKIVYEGVHNQIGEVDLQGASIQYRGSGSYTTMGGWHMGVNAEGSFVMGFHEPDLTIQCPRCHSTFRLKKSDLVGKEKLACPSCNNLSRVGIPP